jgi:hypothetical protein
MTEDNNLFKKSVSHIPEGFLREMQKECKVDTDGKMILEAIKKSKQEGEMPEAKQTVPVPPNAAPAQTPMVGIDGYVFPADFATMVAYTLVKLSKKDKTIRQVLDTFKFTLQDYNKTQVYPLKGKK